VPPGLFSRSLKLTVAHPSQSLRAISDERSREKIDQLPHVFTNVALTLAGLVRPKSNPKSIYPTVNVIYCKKGPIYKAYSAFCAAPAKG
jgi:hypothetical protein